MVLIGAADVAARIARASLGQSAGAQVFGPAALMLFAPEDTPQADPQPVEELSVMVPTRLKVPALGIDAAVEQVGTKADGSMGTPQDFAHVAWYEPGARPGAAGNAVFAGHVNNGLTRHGVFEHLSQIALGDTVEIVGEDGHVDTYRVSDIAAYPADHAPDVSETIFAAGGPSRLVLITCEGEWVPAQKTFSHRLVVTAAPVNP